MKQLSIGKRLSSAFSIILILFSSIVILSVIALFLTGSHFDTFYNQAYTITNKASDLRIKFQEVSKYIGYAMVEEEKEETIQYTQIAKETIQQIQEESEYMKHHFNGDKTIIENYNMVMESIEEDRDRVLELIEENKKTEAISLYFSNVMPMFTKASQYLTDMDQEARLLADKHYNNASNKKIVVVITLFVVLIITIFGTILIAHFIIQSITKPIKEIETAAKEMSLGSLNAKIMYHSKDELGSLADSMGILEEGIRTIIEDTGAILEEMGKGNFHIESNCKEKYKKDYAPILRNIYFIRDILNETLVQIQNSSHQVAIEANQMKESAQSLAEGTMEQAGAVQELTAMVEDLAAMAEDNAESTKKAYQAVETSAEQAKHGRIEMDELLKAIEQINTTSKEIGNIIITIEDIADQTNLLSLNAAIEAARAGEEGKGFTVVAEKIGKLAAESAQSVVDTKALINKTLEEIEIGNCIIEKILNLFKQVIEDMEQFAELAEDSNKMSREQFYNLEQVKLGIEQISTVIQSNSIAAEDNSAISEQLFKQVDKLEEKIGYFHLL